MEAQLHAEPLQVVDVIDHLLVIHQHVSLARARGSAHGDKKVSERKIGGGRKGRGRYEYFLLRGVLSHGIMIV